VTQGREEFRYKPQKRGFDAEFLEGRFIFPSSVARAMDVINRMSGTVSTHCKTYKSINERKRNGIFSGGVSWEEPAARFQSGNSRGGREDLAVTTMSVPPATFSNSSSESSAALAGAGGSAK